MPVQNQEEQPCKWWLRETDAETHFEEYQMNANKHVVYDKHQEEWDQIVSDPDRNLKSQAWFRKDTLDYWRHARMYAPLNPIVLDDKDASWITIGDGRYGTDANYLISTGAKKVHCTDISDTMLRIGNEKGFIDSYSAENAESIRFPDNSFDYVYCKEAFHHFPRPYIALHEMFRVARRAVVLTEPRDQYVDRANFSVIFRILRRLLRKSPEQHSFETVGNYVYATSEREIEKFLLGMHYNKVAFTGCNDAFIPGVQFVQMNSRSRADRWLRFMIKARIQLLNALTSLRVMNTGLVTAAIFKSDPSPAMLSAMQDQGWRVKDLPRNPFVETRTAP
jgi:ubiquinone/menaquinone biosynthesis C-methylase UbiE